MRNQRGVAGSWLRRISLSAALLGLAAAGQANEAEFYKGKTVNIIVSTKPGGGYDAYARLLAKVLPKHLPGITPVVKNVPGAGHIIGCNEVFRSKPDGLTFGTFNKGLITSQLVAMEGIKFDLRKMSWLGTPATEPRVLVMSTKSGIKNVADLQKAKQVLICSAGVGSSSHNDAIMVGEILGFEKNLKVVPGYAGTEGDLAMMRGEIMGQIGSLDSMRSMITNKEAVPILLISNKRTKEFPNLPNILEYAKEGKKKAMADLMVAQALLSRPFAGPPGIPPERLKFLRQAFEAAWNDPELLAMAKKSGLSLEFQDGDEVAQAVNSAMNQTPEMINFFKSTVESKD